MAKRAPTGTQRARLAAAALLLAATLLRRSWAPGPRAEEAAGAQDLALLVRPRPDIERVVLAAFPGALTGHDVRKRLLLSITKYGLNRGNTIYGQSIGSDEINQDEGHLTTILTKYYGRHFPLGGIGGAPYVGKTGFTAFSRHVPDDGHVLVVFGPHIGFGPDGQPGKFLRRGQDRASDTCGAVIAAYRQCASGLSMPADPQDIMQSWLREKLRPHCADVAKSSNQMVELAMRMYRVVEEEMLKIINTDYGSGNLVLLGGIQINMPYPHLGRFMPLHFTVRSSSLAPVNLMPVFR